MIYLLTYFYVTNLFKRALEYYILGVLYMLTSFFFKINYNS